MKKSLLFLFCCLTFSCVVPLNEIGKNKPEDLNINPPREIIISPNTVNSALLSWETIENFASFSIYSSTNEFNDYTLVDTTDKNYYIIQNLLTERRYYFKLSVSKNNIGESQLSSPVSIVIVDLSEPTGLLATNNSPTSINISWSSVSGATGYKIYRSLTSSGQYVYVGNTVSNNYTDNNLETGTTYYYKIAGTKSNGEGPSSNFISTFTPVDIPTGLLGTVQSSNSIKLSWNTVLKATEYTLYKSLSSSGEYNTIVTTSNTSYIDTGLSQNTSYYYKISAKNINGEGIQSEYITVIIEPPQSPTSITSSVLSSSSIKLDWGNVVGATSYKIYRSTGGDYNLVGTVTTNTFTNTGLSSNINYSYKISSVNIAGEGEQSEQINSIIQPPSAPINVKAESYTASSIKITWDNVAGANLYKVYLLENYTNYSEIATVTTNEYIHTGLVAGHGRKYLYVVEAINAIGSNSSVRVANGYVKPVALSENLWLSDRMDKYYTGDRTGPKYYSFPIDGSDYDIEITINNAFSGHVSVIIYWQQNNEVYPSGTSMQPNSEFRSTFSVRLSSPESGFFVIRMDFSSSFDSSVGYNIRYNKN